MFLRKSELWELPAGSMTSLQNMLGEFQLCGIISQHRILLTDSFIHCVINITMLGSPSISQNSSMDPAIYEVISLAP